MVPEQCIFSDHSHHLPSLCMSFSSTRKVQPLIISKELEEWLQLEKTKISKVVGHPPGDNSSDNCLGSLVCTNLDVKQECNEILSPTEPLDECVGLLGVCEDARVSLEVVTHNELNLYSVVRMVQAELMSI